MQLACFTIVKIDISVKHMPPQADVGDAWSVSHAGQTKDAQNGFSVSNRYINGKRPPEHRNSM